MTATLAADRALAWRSFRQVRRSAAAWGLAFGATAAASAVTYVDSFPTAASRAQIVASTSGNPALSVLLGPTAEIGSVGGYTVYKGFVFLTSIAALWSLFAATRALRGEEDAGRWQLVLGGATRPAEATVATLLGLLGAVALVGVGTALVLALAGRDPDLAFGAGDSVAYALSLVLVAATFVGIGAVASQLASTRRGANALGGVAFALCTAVRMVADASPAAHWLRWASPLGWSELVRPLTDAKLWPVVPAAAVTLGLGATAAVLARRRDVGAGMLARHAAGRHRSFGLGSPTGFAVRTERGVIAAWWTGTAAAGLFLGFLAQLTTQPVPDSFRGTLGKFGVEGSFARQYFGVAFLLVATLLALLPASQVGAAADEELSGRLVHVLTRPPRRRTWLAGRLAVAAAAVLVAAVLAGLGAWAGASTQHVSLGFTTMVGATLNAVPTALVALGIGAVVLAIVPRAAGATVYVVVIWSVLMDLIGPLVDGAAWVQQLSVFHPMALAPAEPVDATAVAITLLVAAALASAAVVLFERRDLRTG